MFNHWLIFLVCGVFSIGATSDGPILFTPIHFSAAFIEEPATGALVSVQGAFAWYSCDFFADAELCPESWILHTSTPRLSLALAYVDHHGFLQSTTSLHGQIQITEKKSDKSHAVEVDLNAVVDVQSVSLSGSVDIDLEFVGPTSPLDVSVRFPNWKRDVRIVMDLIPPEISITAFHNTTTVMVQFSERVFPVRLGKPTFCQAQLRELSPSYGVMDLALDSVDGCGEDLTQLSLMSIVEVENAESFVVRELVEGDDERPALLVQLSLTSTTERDVTVRVERGRVADYSGNVNQESAALITAVHVLKGDAVLLRSPQSPSNAPRPFCRVMGLVLASWSVVAVLAAYLSVFKRPRIEIVEGLSQRHLVTEIVKDVLAFQVVWLFGGDLKGTSQFRCLSEMAHPFQWWYLQIPFPWNPSCHLLRHNVNHDPEAIYGSHFSTWHILVYLLIILPGLTLLPLPFTSRSRRRNLSTTVLPRLFKASALCFLPPLLLSILSQFHGNRDHALFGVWMAHAVFTPLSLWIFTPWWSRFNKWKRNMTPLVRVALRSLRSCPRHLHEHFHNATPGRDIPEGSMMEMTRRRHDSSEHLISLLSLEIEQPGFQTYPAPVCQEMPLFDVFCLLVYIGLSGVDCWFEMSLSVSCIAVVHSLFFRPSTFHVFELLTMIQHCLLTLFLLIMEIMRRDVQNGQGLLYIAVGIHAVRVALITGHLTGVAVRRHVWTDR